MAVIPVENKGWLTSERKVRSVFECSMGRVELYMDDQVVKSVAYTNKKHRTQILKEWEMWMKNHYGWHVFYIHLIPAKQYKIEL